MQNTWSACKYIDLWWHRSYASFQGQNLRVCWELLKKKKTKTEAKQKTLEEPEQTDRMCQGRTEGLLKNQEAGLSPAPWAALQMLQGRNPV